MPVLIEAALAFFVGLIVFWLLPIYTLGYVSEWFVELALAAVERGILLKRLNAGYTLKASRFSTEPPAEQIRVSGSKYDYEDPHSYMSRLKNRPFGLAHERSNVLVTPRVADTGRRLAEHIRDGTLRKGEKIRKYFAFEPGRVLVDMDHALHVIQGSAPPQRAEIVRKFVKIGQSGFNTTRAATYGIWLTMILGGAGSVYFLLKMRDTVDASNVGVPIPGMILDAVVMVL